MLMLIVVLYLGDDLIRFDWVQATPFIDCVRESLVHLTSSSPVRLVCDLINLYFDYKNLVYSSFVSNSCSFLSIKYILADNQRSGRLASG